MKTWTCFTCLLLITVHSTIISSQTIQITTHASPRELFDGDTSKVTARCEITGTGSVSLPWIRISFKKTSGAERRLAEVVAGSSTPVISDPNLMGRATAVGSINTNGIGSTIILEITRNVSCNETGTYFCETQYTDTTLVTLRSNSSIIGRSDPAELEVRNDPAPPTGGKYAIGTEVSLICSGKVGSPEKSWFWAKFNEETELWDSYTQGVSEDAAVPVSDCAFFRTGTLKFTIPDDKEHKFRCTVGTDVNDSKITSVNAETSGASFVRSSSVMLLLAALYYLF